MVELKEVEEEIDEEYKRSRLKQEKDAIKTIKHNPKYFYTYAKKFSKSKGEIAAFVKENGDLTDDPAEQAEILKKNNMNPLQANQWKNSKSKKIFSLKMFPDQTNDQLKHALLTSHWPSLLCQIA